MQTLFGLRIVGMRVVEDQHQDKEYSSTSTKMMNIRTYPKSYGRSLTTYDAVLDAFRTFFRPASHRILSLSLIHI